MVDTAFQVAGTFTARQGRQVQSVVMAGATAARPLGALSGVRPGTSPTTVSATSTTVTVGPFAGVIDAQTAAEAAPYEFAFDAITTMALTAADPSNPRSDIVFARINDTAEDGGGSTGAVRVYQAGVAGSGAPIPVPAVSPVTRALVVAVINVPKAGGGAPTVTWVAPYCVAAGGQGAVNTSTQLPASGTLGDKILAYDTGIVYRFNGTAWKPWESDWIAFTPLLAAASGSLVSATASMRYKWVAGGIEFWFTANIASAGTAAGNLTATWPVPSLRDVIAVGSETGATGFATQLRINGAGPALIFKYDGSTIIATGRTVSISGYYEA